MCVLGLDEFLHLGFDFYRDFSLRCKADRDSRRFPGHQEVLRYLDDFADEFGLNELILYQTEVRHVGLEKDGKWTVTYERIGEDGGSEVDETYDAVVVCNGHYTEPRVANDIPGIELWPGRQIHSHNYRIPEPYRDQVVVLIGLSASAFDISRDIAELAKEVHIATRSEIKGIFGKHPVYNNMWIHPMIEKAHENGRLSFQDGSEVHADTILHCTGYKYHLPFLETSGVVNVDDNRVGPLYKHVFPPSIAPGLSFIGVPFFRHIGEFEYEDWLAAQCGCPPTEEWRKGMSSATIARLFRLSEIYRDEWDDEDLIVQAHEDFKQYLSAEGKVCNWCFTTLIQLSFFGEHYYCHQEVLRYLEDFVPEVGLNELMLYQTEAKHVGLITDGAKWTVTYQRIGEDGGSEVGETYDAMVVCSGHYTEPRLANVFPDFEAS